MKFKVVLIGAVAGATAMGAMSMIAPTSAHAIELGVGTQAQAGNSTGVSIGGNDARGGILANSRTNVGVNADVNDEERARVYDESDSRINSGVSSRINADTSAGADANADLRSDIRNSAVIDTDIGADADANVNAAADTSANTGLFGISVGSNTRAAADGTFNN